MVIIVYTTGKCMVLRRGAVVAGAIRLQINVLKTRSRRIRIRYRK